MSSRAGEPLKVPFCGVEFFVCLVVVSFVVFNLFFLALLIKWCGQLFVLGLFAIKTLYAKQLGLLSFSFCSVTDPTHTPRPLRGDVTML